MLRSLLLYLAGRETPKRILTHSSVRGRLTARFIAGEDLEDAVRAVRALNAEGFVATLDLLGESVHDRATAEGACRAYLGLLDRIAADGLRSHVSVKLSQLGLEMDEGLARRHVELLAGRAASHHNFVRIDMEGSALAEGTLRVFREAGAPRDVLGVVIQSYLRRSESDVEELIQAGARVRLVKGAYQEPPSVAFQRKAEVDGNYVKLMEKLLARGAFPAVATHDPQLIAAAQAFTKAHGIGRDQFEFQMLYGIRRRLQRELVNEGYRVRIYVPFGKQWYAYFMRRLAERPANLLFLLRNMFRA